MNFKEKTISVINKLPYVRGLFQENVMFKRNSCFPPGHFYSPIIEVEDVKNRQNAIWANEVQDKINGINLNTDEQKKLVREYENYFSELPFTETDNSKNRYYYENGYYSYTDAIFLYSTIRHFSPKKIIEIGCGFSSAVMLDTNSLFFNNDIRLTFIEPDAERLKSLISDNDISSTILIEKNAQEINLKIFDELNSGDILFIDSTHVVKTGSDVNFILFEVLPRLKSGVLIHFHDIFYPFEYPKDWVFEGRNWNEDYFLRAFLMYNSEFEIKLFSHYLHLHHKSVFENMPLCYKNFGGNLWIEKK